MTGVTTTSLHSATLRSFTERDLHAAIEWALAGGQSLHLMSGRFAYMRRDTPRCFKGRHTIAHLFDQNRERLVATALHLGVRVIRVERQDSPGQHIDLCGSPLDRAIAICSVEPPAEQLRLAV